MAEYTIGMGSLEISPEGRWELYRLLGEPLRLRLLALAHEEELAIGELAELLREPQPKISKHVKPLRQAGLLGERKQGARVLVRLAEAILADAVVADAVASGRTLCEADGSLARVATVLAHREAPARAFFAKAVGEAPGAIPAELPAYLTALAPLLPRRRLAIDAGTGDGRLVELLGPIFERVIAFDRSPAQLERARERIVARGYAHVELHEAELGDAGIEARVAALGGATAVFASRMLHHAPRPLETLAALGRLAAPGGFVIVIDYQEHHDEALRDEQADVWLGFAPAELLRLAAAAGLEAAQVHPIPAPRCGQACDAHLGWQALVARRPQGEEER